jgi:Domain of unknown function (DUF4386)
LNDELNKTLPPITPAQQTAARLVGVLYLVQMGAGVLGEMFVRRPLMVRGDATRTAENIMGAEHLFRISIAGDLLTCIAVLVLVWGLYVILRPVNRNLVLLAVFFRLVELAVLSVATVNSLVVLRLLRGADYLKTFDASQLHSLSLLAINIQGSAMSVGFVFLGLGSSVFAYLLLKSGYVPKVLAGWGIFSALLLALGTLAIMIFPTLGRVGLAYMMPMGIYEVGLGLWLLIQGIGVPKA